VPLLRERTEDIGMLALWCLKSAMAAPELTASGATQAALAEPSDSPMQQESLHQVLERYGHNREAAASHLGISRTTLWRRLKQDSEHHGSPEE
jgi:DNA-binding NtrC family response regulator